MIRLDATSSRGCGGWGGWALALAVVGVVAGCQKPESPVTTVPPVQTMVLQQGTTQNFRRFPGEVVAERTFEMSFDVPGRMIERPALQGMTAQKGTLLARLDPERFEARLASANARLVNSREELARRRQLRERGVISASEFDQYALEFQVAEAEQREAQRALEDTRLLAPFDGIVARTLLDNFSSVRPKQPVLVFQDVTQLEVNIDVPEQVMALLGMGTNVEEARGKLDAKAEFPAIPGRFFDLSLKSFQASATETARTFRVSFDLQSSADVNILPGMTCTALLRQSTEAEAAAEEGVFEVPNQAVGSWDGAAVLWRLNADSLTVSAVPVELLGPAGQSMRVRASNLHSGEEIVISGVRFLSEGMKVGRMAPTPR